MSRPDEVHHAPILLKYLTPDEVRRHLEGDPRLLVPVGTTESHGPHLPLGCDTITVEHLADDLSAEFGVLRAPTIEYGVNAGTELRYPGSAGLRRKTLHRVLNDLVGAWEAGGVREFVILTANGQDPHQEALSTLRTRRATVRTVDIFAVPYPGSAGVAGGGGRSGDLPIHGGELDTSLLLYLDGSVVALDRARDFLPPPRAVRRYHRGVRGAIPADSPGSLGRPTLASREQGERLYHLIYDRIATRVFGRETQG